MLVVEQEVCSIYELVKFLICLILGSLANVSVSDSVR